MQGLIIPAGPLNPVQSRFGLNWRERIDWSHTYPIGRGAWNNPFALSQAVDPERAVCQIMGEWGPNCNTWANVVGKAEIRADGQYLDFTSFGGSSDTSAPTFSGSITVLEFKAKPKRIQKVNTKGAAVTLAYSVDPLRTLLFNACFQGSFSQLSAPCHLIDGNTINTDHANASAYCCVYVVEF
ncbi:MAG: hypothetical protein V1797_09670 [Pseudomonadota bacterium]